MRDQGTVVFHSPVTELLAALPCVPSWHNVITQHIAGTI